MRRPEDSRRFARVWILAMCPSDALLDCRVTIFGIDFRSSDWPLRRLMVGAFNLISVAFAALFIGIGLDFGIYSTSRS